ncbi:MAG TPA: hypothetical protein VF141_19075 [Chryseolinea sp.]
METKKMNVETSGPGGSIVSNPNQALLTSRNARPKEPSEIPQPGKDPETVPSKEPEPDTWPRREPEITPGKEPFTTPREIPPVPQDLMISDMTNGIFILTK